MYYWVITWSQISKFCVPSPSLTNIKIITRVEFITSKNFIKTGSAAEEIAITNKNQNESTTTS
jgi:hypothetical protein